MRFLGFLLLASSVFAQNLMDLNGPVLNGRDYRSLASCYAAISASGGTCIIPSGYKETLTENLTLSKSGAGFLCLGSCMIEGDRSITVPPGVYGTFLKGLVPYGGNANTEGFHFI